MLSNSIKSRFCKDFKMPFQVVQEPMFSYYMHELNEKFETNNKLFMLQNVIDTLGSEEEFFKESNRVKDSIITSIQSQPEYLKLQEDRLDNYNTINQIKQQDIYNMGNVNKTFISVDLKHANFNVFKMYDKALTLGFDNYDDLVSSVTSFEYFKKSKYLRQVIFGNMLPKKQQRLQKWVMDQVITVLHKDVGIELKDFMSASADEVVFVVEPNDVDSIIDLVNRKLNLSSLTSNVSTWCRVESFTLKSIGDKKYFVKENIDGTMEFKGIPSYFFMQVYKKYMNQEITEMDKMFYFDGMMATFNKSLFDEGAEVETEFI